MRARIATRKFRAASASFAQRAQVSRSERKFRAASRRRAKTIGQASEDHRAGERRPSGRRAKTIGVAGVLGIVMVGFVPGARAVPETMHYDGATKGDFRTAPYVESGIRAAVSQGHYDITANPTGNDGNYAFTVDEETPGSTPANPVAVPATVTFSLSSGVPFDAKSLEVINPADTVGEYTISGVGGSGGEIPAPVVAGHLDLTQYAPAFQGLTGLVITQHTSDGAHPHALTIDDVTVEAAPEPGAVVSLCAGCLTLLALSRRRAR
jgi:hypothetical protein